MALTLLIGALAAWMAFYIYRRSPGVQRGRWRVGSGLLSMGVLAAAGFVAVRGQYLPAAVLGLAGFVLLGMARSRREPPPAQTPATRLSAAQARDILGVGATAGPEDIQAAYTRLMRLAHPDKGGTSGLAAQLNAARDRLLK
jgi:hypothetical protein